MESQDTQTEHTITAYNTCTSSH